MEKEVFPAVEKYLESAADGNWKEVYETLAGEALMEARANTGRVKTKEKIVSKKLKVSQSLKDIVEVKADFTISRVQWTPMSRHDFLNSKRHWVKC